MAGHAIAAMSGAGRVQRVRATYHDVWSLDGMEMRVSDAASEEEMAGDQSALCRISIAIRR